MDSSEGIVPSFCIGLHESKRTVPITSEVVQLAHESNVYGKPSPLAFVSTTDPEFIV